jgi:chromosome partitioning protein
MRVITIGQRKGGNGKTTSALNLAHAFAELGARVLLIDLDDQKNGTSAIQTLTTPAKTVEDLLLDPALSVADVAVATSWERVSLVAASGSLSGAIRELESEVGSHMVLAEKLRSCTGFDIIFIDTSPSLNILVVNALCASDWLLVPLSSKYFSLQGLEQTLEAFGKTQKRLNSRLQMLGLAFVIHDKRSSLAVEVMEKARSAYPELVCQTWVGQNIKIEEAQVARQSILGYAPGDRGAVQYRQLAMELARRMGIPEGNHGQAAAE